MKNLNYILTLGTGAMLLLASCSTSYNAMRGGETDDLYFMSSDAQIATEYAVSNNNPQNFQSLSTISSDEFDQENFSARNVNPEYLARYQSPTSNQEEGTVYFDESQGEESNPNVNVYNNFYGSGAGLPGQGFNQSRVNLNLGFGMGMGGFGFGGPMMGGFGWGAPMMGWGSPWMMGGFYDPFFDPFWGPGMGFGMRPGFGWGMGPRFGMGWNSMWGMNMGFGWGGGFGWGNPMMGMGGFGMMGPGWGWGGRPIVVTPGYPGEAGRQIVRGARPGRGAGTSVGAGNLAPSNRPATTRAARRDAATSASRVGSNRSGLTSSSSRNANRDFGTSQNEYVRQNSRIANTSARPGVRNTGSAAATRPSSRTGLNNSRPTYTNTNRQNTRSAYSAPSRANTNRSNMGTRTNPSYNRGNTGSFNNNRMAPSRSMSPSRNSMSSPSRSSSPAMRSAPSRSSGGGFSSGGGSRGGGGGMSSGGSRGGRGN